MTLRMRILGIAAASCLAVAVAALPNVAAAAPASATSQANGGSTLNMTAIRASIASHNGTLTMAEASRLGIKPNTQYANTPLAATLHRALIKSGTGGGADPASIQPSTVRPMDAAGCAGKVCIGITGKGLHVDSWITSADVSAYQCSFGGFWEDGGLIDTGPEVCDSNGVLWNQALDVDFSEDTHVCNSWLNISGKPCEEVHS
ncbi:hypothetical protein [Streptacidiphilus cavernicola]|uniref:Secreted protein n=1 Tax=Streptacidiphilus cavernicola TaxID=3342716 RepID=A0ABV6W233_9ACTN